MAANVVTLKIPAPSGVLARNLLGILGLVGFAVALGGLTGSWWWTLLTASVEAVFLCVVTTVNAEQEESDEQGQSPHELATVRPRTA